MSSLDRSCRHRLQLVKARAGFRRRTYIRCDNPRCRVIVSEPQISMTRIRISVVLKRLVMLVRCELSGAFLTIVGIALTVIIGCICVIWGA